MNGLTSGTLAVVLAGLALISFVGARIWSRTKNPASAVKELEILGNPWAQLAWFCVVGAYATFVVGAQYQHESGDHIAALFIMVHGLWCSLWFNTESIRLKRLAAFINPRTGQPFTGTLNEPENMIPACIERHGSIELLNSVGRGYVIERVHRLYGRMSLACGVVAFAAFAIAS